MKRALSRTVGVALAVGGLMSPAYGQLLTNGNFSTGDLTGWSVEPTFNGTTIYQNVDTFDMDGPGPLAPSLAARFGVGNIVSMSGNQAGIELVQMVDLTAGTQYAFSFNWAATHTGTSGSNAEGGVFTLFVESETVHSGAAGSTTAGCIRHGFLEGMYTASMTGPHRVGVRITRQFTVPGTLQQWVDNGLLQVAATGACCLPTGACETTTAAACSARQGTYGGNGSDCGTTPCIQPPQGACCLPTSVCQELSLAACLEQNGTYMGHNTLCGINDCPVILDTLAAQSAIGDVTAGAFFDLSSTQTITVPRIDYYSNASVNNVAVVEVWVLPGSYVGNTGSSTGWVLHDTVPYISQGTGATRTRLTLNNPLVIEANATVGVYLQPKGGGLRARGSGTTIPVETSYTDGTLSIFTDAVVTSPWSGAPLANRAWAGRIYYTMGGQTSGCYANCDGSTVVPVLNVDDFTCFINEYASAQQLPPAQQVGSYANCDHSTTHPVLNVDDFTCFINEYAQGCP